MALTAGKGGSRKTERWLSPPGLEALKGRNIHTSVRLFSLQRKTTPSPFEGKGVVALFRNQELLFPVVPDVLDIVVIFHGVDELLHPKPSVSWVFTEKS